MAPGGLGDEELRRHLLRGLGASGSVLDELLAYGANPLLDEELPPFPPLPLADEPHLEAWREYAEAALTAGVWSTLADRLVQLRFPIRAGISQEDAYRGATRRGFPAPPDNGLVLEAPERLTLELHPSLASTVPILVSGSRADFVTLVRALSGRNEPIPVPDSMGACLVAGLVNWDRVATLRRRWEAVEPSRRGDQAAWSEELRSLTQQKELYQDRLVLLSRGPYSNVAAADVGLEESEWLQSSLGIRREHECTHYFTLRLFGRLQHNLLEELVADLVGLLRGLGEFRPDLALRFLGLESFPAYRSGGRLENYRGRPPLSDAAFSVLTRLAHTGITKLDRLCRAHPEWCSETPDLARLVAALTTLTMEELAAEDGAARVEDRMTTLFG